MAIAAGAAESDEPNDPRAVRMGVIAFVVFNTIIGSIFGTPGVLLKPMMGRLGVGMEQASLGPLAVIVASAVFGPIIGSLASKVSLRKLVLFAALALSANWLILAFTHSLAAYLLSYALLVGPTMAIGASIVPPTLVTRWFNRNRGLAIGLVHIPIVVAIMPILAAWAMERFGMDNTFLALAVFPLVTLLPCAALLVDRPAGQEAKVAAMVASGDRFALTIPQLLAKPSYWAICLAVGVVNASSTMLGTHVVAMTESWGVEHIAAAGLASIMSLVGMAGMVVFGILADRIGGAKSLLFIVVCDVVLYALFLLHLPYAGLALVIGLIGFCGSGAVPATIKAFGDTFGRESLSRANGLMVAVTLPVLFAGMIGPGTVVRVTGGYTVLIYSMVAAFAVATLLAFSATKAKPVTQ